MSGRLQGFEIMDVSTALPNDPKVKRLAREYPDQLCPAFLVYVSTLAESWKAGQRVPYDDAWPSYLPFDQATVDALRAVRLLDEQGRVTSRGWRGYFEPARKRRAQGRKRWQDWKERQSRKPSESNGNANGQPTDSKPLANGQPTDSNGYPTGRPTESKKKRSSAAPQISKKKTTSPHGAQLDAAMVSDDDEPEEAVDRPAWAQR